MTIEVEDGTGKANAASYVSNAEATAYFAARGVSTWDDVGDTTAQEAALVRATFALDSWLRGSWVGVKKTATQALAWPRIEALEATTGVLDEDGYELSPDAVPAVVKTATYEVALIELTESFIQTSVSRDNTVSSETVGPISVAYRGDSPTIKRYPHIEALLSGVANTAGVRIGMNIYLTPEEIEAQSEGDPYDLGDYVIKSY